MEKSKNKIIIYTSSIIQRKIFTIRDQQVMKDRDLAELYYVETRILKQAVRRNIKRFPEDFMFILTESEIDFLVSQSVIPSKKYLGGAKPFVFTEQGIAILSSVLTSDKAIEINIQIMRAFVEMRKFIANNVVIFQRLQKVEQKQIEVDGKFNKIFDALQRMKMKNNITSHIDDFNHIVSVIQTARNNAFAKVNEELINLYYNVGQFVYEKV
ncbi:MAG TPA: ORF6N domain-containing protein, partial [Ignavibacteria bacterium]|nr:ORF6N domain-containing protein [Ignavibacteria bacterium]